MTGNKEYKVIDQKWCTIGVSRRDIDASAEVACDKSDYYASTAFDKNTNDDVNISEL